VLSSHLHFQVVSFSQVSPPKPHMKLSFPPCMLHALPPSFFISSLRYYLVGSTDHRACSLLYSPITSFLLGLNIILSTLFPNTLSQYSYLIVRDQGSHPYKMSGKIIVLYFYRKLKDKTFCTEW
jgi:hypothetical protein